MANGKTTAASKLADKLTIPVLTKRVEASARMSGANHRGKQIDPRVADAEWDRIFVVHGLRNYGAPVQRSMRDSFMTAFWRGAARGLANPAPKTPEWFEVGQRAYRETMESEPIPYIVRSAPAFRAARDLSDEEVKRIAYHYYAPRPFETSPVPSQRLPRQRKNSPEWDGMKAEIQRGWDAAAKSARAALVQNPAVTDRALRYRANANPPTGPKRCLFCGSTRNVEVGHLDGHEEHNDSSNLAWNCRSCNTTLGVAFKKLGLGRRTRQYNPEGGAKSLGQWVQAIQSLRGESGAMEPAAALEMIRATPADDRSAYSLQAWRVRRKRYGSTGRQNPEGPAAELYEKFHGKPSERIDVIEESVHYHENLAALGQLVELKIKTPTRIKATLAFAEEGPDVATLASSEDGRQLFVVGGNQELDLRAIEMDGPEWVRDLMDVGELIEVTYHTAKGFHKFEPINYFHKLGEETGVKPRLLYDTRNKRLLIAGGQYEVKPEGIVN